MSPLLRIQPFAAVIYIGAGLAFAWDYSKRQDWISGLLAATLLLTGIARLFLWRSIRRRALAQAAAAENATADGRRARPWHGER